MHKRKLKLYREYIFGNQCIAKLGYYKRLEAFVVLVAANSVCSENSRERSKNNNKQCHDALFFLNLCIGVIISLVLFVIVEVVVIQTSVYASLFVFPINCSLVV